MSGEWIRYAARAVAIGWGLFWSWFGLASGIGERLPLSGTLLHALAPGGLFLVSALVAWRWETAGSWLLVIEGLAIAAVYPLWTRGHFPTSTIVFVLLTMALPPLIAGLLLLLRGRPEGQASASSC